YDGLVADLGGQSTPAVGFALGCERVIELLQQKINLTHKLDVYLITVGEVAENIGVLLAELIRRECPKITLLANCGGGSFKSQFKRADKSGAQFALVLGDDEIKNNTIAVKYLREEKPQIVISTDKIFSFLNENV
ncbi:MAG: His/Gly/Thr/Pro-type tRNA ligase C-terminal domain-containing protein, partial [Gammaproteobacteria bacterium]